MIQFFHHFTEPDEFADYDLGTKIVGGFEAEDHQFPFMAGL